MSLPELLYNDLQPGRQFTPFRLECSEAFVASLLEALDETNPIYTDPAAAREAGYAACPVPAAIAGIYGRRSYLEEHRMPPGGILAKQEIEIERPVYVGDTVTATATVKQTYLKREKNYAEIETVAVSGKGERVGTVRLTAIWPK